MIISTKVINVETFPICKAFMKQMTRRLVKLRSGLSNGSIQYIPFVLVKRIAQSLCPRKYISTKEKSTKTMTFSEFRCISEMVHCKSFVFLDYCDDRISISMGE